MSKINYSKKEGFTLVEMLVSVAIFSIILIIVLGTIVSIVDTSRKARTLIEVMNDLNFTFESMTRTLKTARSIEYSSTYGNPSILAINQNGEEITYSIVDDGGRKRLQKQIGSSDPDYLTSSEVNITSFLIEQLDSYDQPRIFFSIRGRVDTTRGVASEFSMQSTVSQRRLEIN